jgi:hypothetical protein
MGVTLSLLGTIFLLLLLVARPFLKGAYKIPILSEVVQSRLDNSRNFQQYGVSRLWKFDPHEEKILQQLLMNWESGISVAQLNDLLNVGEKSAENQRQRRHLVIKELNTKLFVLFNIRECIVRVPEAFDSRKKQYVILISEEVSKELSHFLSI